MKKREKKKKKKYGYIIYQQNGTNTVYWSKSLRFYSCHWHFSYERFVRLVLFIFVCGWRGVLVFLVWCSLGCCNCLSCVGFSFLVVCSSVVFCVLVVS